MAASALGLLGCKSLGGAPEVRSEARVLTPASVTQTEPGGDSDRPEQAALRRLLTEPFALRVDRRRSVLVPLPDAERWKRVRPAAFTPLTAFRYGDAHHAVVVVFQHDTEQPGPTSAECIDSFERWAEPRAQLFGVVTSPPREETQRIRNSDIVVRFREGARVGLFRKHRYTGAYAALTPFRNERACLVVAVVVSANDDAQLAARVRRRLMDNVFSSLVVLRRQPVDLSSAYAPNL